MESDFALEIEEVRSRFTNLRSRLLSTIEFCESRLKREEARLKDFKETGESEWKDITPEQWEDMLCTEINKLRARIHTEKEALVRLESIAVNS